MCEREGEKEREGERERDLQRKTAREGESEQYRAAGIIVSRSRLAFAMISASKSARS